jgi:hypothetical protein
MVAHAGLGPGVVWRRTFHIQVLVLMSARRTPDVSLIRAAVQAVNSTTSPHPENWPADRVTSAAASWASASQSGSASERGSSSSSSASWYSRCHPVIRARL